MDREEILRYNDVVLTRSDLEILRFPCYLDDKIMDLYFSYLHSNYCSSEDVLLVSPVTSTLIANCNGDLDCLRSVLEPLRLPERQLVIFAVNNGEVVPSEELEEGAIFDEGSHWSLLAYDRTSNTFVHHDSMAGVNHDHAVRLYDAVKGHVGSQAATSSSKNRPKKNNKKKNDRTVAAAKPSSAPLVSAFVECPTPQQTNGYDCGLYVLAIARVLCKWYDEGLAGGTKCHGWLATLEKEVDTSVESRMRMDILMLVQELMDA